MTQNTPTTFTAPPSPLGESVNRRDIDDIFRTFQALSNEIDRLKPEAWETLDDDARLADLSDRIGALTLERIDLFNNPAGRREALEAFFDTQDVTQDPIMREYFRWFALTAYAPRDESRLFQEEAAQMEKKFADFEATKTAFGSAAGWQAQAAELEKMFDLRRALAAPAADVMGIAPSEVTLDTWNPHMRNADVDDMIRELAALKPLLHDFFAGKIDAAKQDKPLDIPPIDASHEEVVKDMFTRLRAAIMEQAGWPQERLERENITVHPIQFGPNGYSWGAPNNMRMGVEYVDGNFLRGIGILIHETGHLLYMLSRNEAPDAIKGTPAGHINGYSTHEMAAMTLEQAATKAGFATALVPLLKDTLPQIVLDENGALKPEWTEQNLARQFTHQDHSDTYWCASEIALIPNMIWRTLAERNILDGTMTISELPQFWADTMEEWTGRPHDPKDFELGESHWLDDNAGYFWAYQFGAIAASMSHAVIATAQDNAPAPTTADTFNATSSKKGGIQDSVKQAASYFTPYIDFLKAHVFDAHCLKTPQQILDGMSARPEERYTAYQSYCKTMMGMGDKEQNRSARLEAATNKAKTNGQ